MQNGKDDDARHPASQNVDGIVRQDIDSGQTHQYEQREHAIEQNPIAATPGQNHEDGGYADMTAGEGSCGTFACSMGILYHVVEETVAIARHGQWLIVGGEIVVNIGKYALCDVLNACCQIIVLWTRDRQEDKHNVIDEERSQDDEGRTVELLITAEEVKQCYKSDHREIRNVAQVHEFAEHRV